MAQIKVANYDMKIFSQHREKRSYKYLLIKLDGSRREQIISLDIAVDEERKNYFAETRCSVCVRLLCLWLSALPCPSSSSSSSSPPLPSTSASPSHHSTGCHLSGRKVSSIFRSGLPARDLPPFGPKMEIGKGDLVQTRRTIGRSSQRPKIS